jgi:hypothetical protein
METQDDIKERKKNAKQKIVAIREALRVLKVQTGTS